MPRKTLVALSALTVLATLWASVAFASGGGDRGVSHSASRIRGQVHVAGEPAAGWRVELYAAGPNGSRFLDSAVSNIGGNTVSQLVGGDPSNVRTWGRNRRCKNRFTRPWGLASDQQGRIWVTNFGRNSVSVIDPDSARPLCPTATYRLGRPGPRSQPQGLALDMDGNVWVAQTGAGTVTLLEASKGFRRPKTFNADSTSVGPWGIAVDGANNFDNDEVCLEGAAIPPSGEGSTVGEERLQTQCGGNGAVVVFGIAAPVAAPLIGPPVQP